MLERLLDGFEQLDVFIDLIRGNVLLHESSDLGCLEGLGSHSNEELVNTVKGLCISLQRLAELRGDENVLQIDPLLLALDPSSHDVVGVDDLFFQIFAVFSHESDESVTEDHVDSGERIIDRGVEVGDLGEDVHAVSVFVDLQFELGGFPGLLEFGFHGGQLVLTDGSDGNLFDFFLVGNDVHVDETLEGEAVLLDVELGADQLVDLGPVVGLELGATEGRDDGHGTAEGLYELLELAENWIVGHGLLESAHNLGVFSGFLLDDISLDSDETRVEFVLGVGLPVTERAPHEAPVKQVFPEVIKVIEDGARSLKSLLPRVVGLRARLQFLERLLLVIKLLDHFVHVGGAVKIGGVLRLVVKGFDLLVQVGDQTLELPLKPFILHRGFGLYLLNNVLERFALLVGLFEVVLVTLRHDHVVLVQDSVVGLVKINSISVGLVMLVDLMEGISLSAEIFYRVNGLFELLHALGDPVACGGSAFTVNAGNEGFDVTNVPLRSGQQHRLNVAGVDLEKTDIGLLG